MSKTTVHTGECDCKRCLREAINRLTRRLSELEAKAMTTDKTYHYVANPWG